MNHSVSSGSQLASYTERKGRQEASHASAPNAHRQPARSSLSLSLLPLFLFLFLRGIQCTHAAGERVAFQAMLTAVLPIAPISLAARCMYVPLVRLYLIHLLLSSPLHPFASTQVPRSHNLKESCKSSHSLTASPPSPPPTPSLHPSLLLFFLCTDSPTEASCD